MTAHRPKTAALIAYAEGLLSDEGSRRVERHLEGCEICRAELAAMELYDDLLESVHSQPMPALDFGRMEGSLEREARSLSRELAAQRAAPRRRWLPYAAAAAAAAALALLAWSQLTPEPAPRAAQRDATSPDRAAPAPPPQPARLEPVLLEPVVTLAAGTPRRVDVDAPSPIEVGDVLPEGARVAVDAGALHVRLAEATGIEVHPRTALALRRARASEVRLELARGAVGQQVAPLAGGARYVVEAGEYAIEVRGTRFVVSNRDGVVGVDLSEGRVEVRGPDTQVVLTAPARWRSDGSHARAPLRDGDPRPVAVRHASAAEGSLTPVRFAHPDVERWSFDGTALEAPGPVSLRAAPGEHTLRGWDARGRLLEISLPIGEAPVEITPAELQPEGPHLRPGHLEPEEIAPVLARGSRQMEQCYEHALREGASVAGRARLRVTVAVDGSVRRARVLGLSGDGAASLARCITRYASRWSFPPPGGPLSFDQPLHFAPIQ